MSTSKNSEHLNLTKADSADTDDKDFNVSIDEITQYESGNMDQYETIKFFQKLVDSGLVWQFQGHYGRVATELIRAGMLIPGPPKE